MNHFQLGAGGLGRVAYDHVESGLVHPGTGRFHSRRTLRMAVACVVEEADVMGDEGNVHRPIFAAAERAESAITLEATADRW